RQRDGGRSAHGGVAHGDAAHAALGRPGHRPLPSPGAGRGPAATPAFASGETLRHRPGGSNCDFRKRFNLKNLWSLSVRPAGCGAGRAAPRASGSSAHLEILEKFFLTWGVATS